MRGRRRRAESSQDRRTHRVSPLPVRWEGMGAGEGPGGSPGQSDIEVLLGLDRCRRADSGWWHQSLELVPSAPGTRRVGRRRPPGCSGTGVAGGSDGCHESILWWRSRSSSQGGDGLKVERLVTVTVELLDEAGSRRSRCGSSPRRLGRSQMAAYRHVGSRDELLLLAALEVESPAAGSSATDPGTSSSRPSCAMAGRRRGRPIRGSSS